MQQKIQMVDLHGQYLKIKAEVDAAIAEVIDSSAFIGGPAVGRFASALAQYTGAAHVIPCGNGTDALQIALMALGLRPGDEVIVPAFTYVASAEVIALLGLRPVLVDVDRSTFNIDISCMERALTPRTRAVIPVHLFGQSCDMAPVLDFATAHGLYVVEDNAQSLGAVYTFPDGRRRHTGTLGHIGCTSFFPSKNLGCYGDGGALFTDDPELAERIRMTANHGQRVKYHHDVVGCNSRLDTLQAAVLEVKLRHLDEYCTARWEAAARYRAFEGRRRAEGCPEGAPGLPRDTVDDILSAAAASSAGLPSGGAVPSRCGGFGAERIVPADAHGADGRGAGEDSGGSEGFFQEIGQWKRKDILHMRRRSSTPDAR